MSPVRMVSEGIAQRPFGSDWLSRMDAPGTPRRQPPQAYPPSMAPHPSPADPRCAGPAPGALPLHERLRRLRAEAGLSYQQLSARSYVDVGYLHRLETGRAARSSRDVLIRTALGLGLSLEAADELIAAAGHLPLLPAR